MHKLKHLVGLLKKDCADFFEFHTLLQEARAIATEKAEKEKSTQNMDEMETLPLPEGRNRKCQ